MNHGTLVSSDISDANANFRQKWGLDQLGVCRDITPTPTTGTWSCRR